MATSESTINYILDQIISLNGARARKMFGEYALYCSSTDGQEKVVALVCDNELFVKITEQGKQFVGDKYEEGFPYPGAKPAMLISGDLIEDRRFICELISITADSLPAPKPKLKKKSKAKKF